jgi:hypothetical protein
MATSIYISKNMAENNISSNILITEYLTQESWRTSFTINKDTNVGIILKI